MTSPREQIERYLRRLADWRGDELTFMEVCGTHTVSAARSGLHSLLPRSIRLISGPGCPVCVTPVSYVDHALALSKLPEVTIVTFGDLVRVPGSSANGPEKAPPSLAWAKARGADVKVVYSPLDALELARELKDRQVVFLSVGFETTTPVIAAALQQAIDSGIENFSLLTANKTIIQPLLALGTSSEIKIHGFLCPGHVSVVIGSNAYRSLAEIHGIPCAIAGFEPLEMVRAIVALTEQVSQNHPRVDNCYRAAVRPEGNSKALEVMFKLFEPCDSVWRGIGEISDSGLKLRAEYRKYDAAQRFKVELPPVLEPLGCRCGDVLRGVISPSRCGLFGKSCTPDSPKGACMVSSEGSCAAYYQFRQEDGK
ncbi:MAG: hydrogenase formation protein HypD [Deltaproteobacteria bacterium]|nr:hydrogenase formation protein HypD [Deltaproteobacteria bacterium]